MKFYIQQEVIDEKDILRWAQEVQGTSHEEWLCDVAGTILNYLDDTGEMSLRTSGSTGTPKIIALSKKSMRLSARKTGQKFRLKPGMTSYNCLPAKYIAGKMMVIRALELGLDQVLVAPTIKVDTSFNNEIDFAAMIPMQVSYLLESERSFMEQISCLIIGGAPITLQLKEQLSNLRTQSFATYGMTETITHVAVAPLKNQSWPLVYEALPGIRFYNDEGQLVIHADHLDVKEVKTRDMVALKDEFHFKWLGRADNVINSGGVKVSPEVLEQKLSHNIKDPFFVSSIPDEATGDKVILLIESPGYNEKEYAILKRHLSKFNSGERPQTVFFIPQFRRTETGKILRNLNLYGL